MYKIHFYRDKSGKQLVLEYMKELKQKKDKDSRIKLNKINISSFKCLWYCYRRTLYKTSGWRYLGIKTVEGQNPVRGMEQRQFCPVASLYEKDTENTGQRD